MKKLTFSVVAAAAALTIPSVASAEEVEPFIGVSGGYHDLDLGDGIQDDGAIIGVVAGVDVPVGDTFFIGAEGNYHFGTDAIDSEYGVAARVGIRAGKNSKFYLRGGFQEVDLDLGSILDAQVPDGLDDTDGDYIVGAGAEFGLGGGRTAIRLGVDSIAFDTARATAGVILKF